MPASTRLALSRVILFAGDLETATTFYRDVLGLAVVGEEPGWVQLAAGPIALALHRGAPPRGRGQAPKIVFYARDVARTRARLNARGARLGEVHAFGRLRLCDGRDPAGNPFQLSNRRR